MVSVAPRPTCFCKLFLIYELSVFIVMLQSVSKCRNFFCFMYFLALSLPIPLQLYTLPYWHNPPFSIFDIWVICCTGLGIALMSKIKNDGLDQYCTERFEQQQFVTPGVEWVNIVLLLSYSVS